MPGGCITQEGTHCGFRQRGTQQKPLRIHWEKDINRGNIAVAGMFLGEEQRLFVGVRGQTASGGAFAVSQSTNLSIPFTADLLCIGDELCIEIRTAPGKLRVLGSSRL